MKNKTFQKVSVALGWTLLLASLAFLAASLLGEGNIRVNIGNTVAFFESVIPDVTVGLKEERSNNEMPSVSCEGQDYAALLAVPRLSVKLPVRASWDKKAVKKVPCRFSGSVYDGTLVIGGTDAEGQFDFISRMDVGDEITVTDAKGARFSYTVSAVRHAKNADADTLIDGKSDLTLFVKDRKIGSWLLVRCNMK